MSRADESVERVLAGLRDVSAPAGMELRVMQAVEQRAANNVPNRWSGLWATVWIVAGCAAAIIVAAAVVPAIRRSNTPAQVHLNAAPASATAVTREAAGGRVIYAVEQPVVRSQARATMRRAAAGRARSAALTTNRPAPPEPMTKEERLLLEVARRQDPKALELLNPEAQRAREMEAKAEFDRFFGLSEGSRSE